MRRALITWLVALGVAALVGAGVVAALNATVFGAGSFVRVYLDAVARDDMAGALSIPGVDTAAPDTTATQRNAAPRTAVPRTTLLQDGTLAGLTDIQQTADIQRGGIHLVSFDWTTPGGSGSTTFQVERVGTRFGLFPEWAFAVSPVATVSLNVEHDARFTVNGVAAVSPTRSNAAVSYTVLVPGAYIFANNTRYLRAAPDVVLADTVSANLSGVVDTQANADFGSVVTRVVHEALTKCATQTVLFPTGCPFGQSVDNRLSSAPAWSIVQQPTINIVPGSDFGTWALSQSSGTAHLTAQVTSLYDGTVSTFDQDVPFDVDADITLGTGDAIAVTLR